MRDRPEESRYELLVDGRPAGLISYRMSGKAIALLHTEVDAAYEGQGLGSRLIAAALQDARQRGLVVEPRCPFVASYLERHPEDRDLIV